MSKYRKKNRSPKRVLALPAVLNSLTSKSGQRTYNRAITDFVECTAQHPVSPSIAPSSSDTESTSNRSCTHRPQSIYARPPCVRWPTRPHPTGQASAPNRSSHRQLDTAEHVPSRPRRVGSDPILARPRSIQTTERSCVQTELRDALNDRMGIEPEVNR